MTDEVVLLDFDPSMFGMRVRIALAEKGMEYEYKQEDLFDKSSLLLQMNPIHKKIPVLIHNGRPVCESLIIVQYIDEVWNDKAPLLPSDPYQRAQARFLADYIDKKVYRAARAIVLKKGEKLEEAKKEFLDIIHQLEETLGEKPYFGGEVFGVVDIALVGYYPWFYSYEVFGNMKFKESCPKIVEWARRCMQKETVSKSLVDEKTVYDFVCALRKRYGVE